MICAGDEVMPFPHTSVLDSTNPEEQKIPQQSSKAVFVFKGGYLIDSNINVFKFHYIMKSVKTR